MFLMILEKMGQNTYSTAQSQFHKTPGEVSLLPSGLLLGRWGLVSP